MILVRDFQLGDIIYYWSSPEGEVISPALSSVRAAQEWRQYFLNSSFKGVDRRKSDLDRRTDSQMRNRLDEELFQSSKRSYGRRVTDLPLQIDIDLVESKLKDVLVNNGALKQGYTPPRLAEGF